MKKKTALLIAMMLILVALLSACGSSSSSYSLHNKDGSLNMQYVNDMNDYFKKHPEKLPK